MNIMLSNSNSYDIEKVVCSKLLTEQLIEILKTLSHKENEIMLKYFGLEDGRRRTLEELAHLYGVNKERIRQIKDKAIKKLRHPNRANKLEDYLEVYE